MLDWQTAADHDSVQHTPYLRDLFGGLVFEWLEGLGGLEAMFEINRRKAASYMS